MRDLGDDAGWAAGSAGGARYPATSDATVSSQPTSSAASASPVPHFSVARNPTHDASSIAGATADDMTACPAAEERAEPAAVAAGGVQMPQVSAQPIAILPLAFAHFDGDALRLHHLSPRASSHAPPPPPPLLPPPSPPPPIATSAQNVGGAAAALPFLAIVSQIHSRYAETRV